MTTDLTAGLTLVDDITTAADGLRNGDWLSASLGTLSAGAAFLDPIGTLFEQGIGWALEHLQPLAGWLIAMRKPQNTDARGETRACTTSFNV